MPSFQLHDLLRKIQSGEAPYSIFNNSYSSKWFKRGGFGLLRLMCIGAIAIMQSSRSISIE